MTYLDKNMPKPDHFMFLLIEDFSHLAFANAVEPLRIANLVSGQQLYRWSLVAEGGVSQRCSNGAVTLVDQGLDALGPQDRLFVVSGIHVANRITQPVLDYLRRAARTARCVGAICSGAFVLAKAGLLAGKPASIHWEFHEAVEEGFPEVDLQRTVFVADEKRPTCSGGSATADMMLHLIARKHGMELAVKIADQMVYSTVRNDQAEQRVSPGARFGARKEKLTRAIRLMEQSLEAPMSSTELADEIGLSPRQMERLFRKYLNETPSQYYQALRLDKAQKLLLLSDLSVMEISLACGYSSASHFSRVFRNAMGVSPYNFRLVGERA